jgi:carbon-monoxide dehydrogenase large subunit
VGYVGRSVPRWADARLVLGRGRFTDDLDPPGLLHVAFVRSPHAHARIRSVDLAAARAHPGVAAAVAGDDLAGRVRPFWSGLQRGPFRSYALYPLARNKVRLAGEAVAAVAAADRYVAEDAAELVRVEYEPLPAVVDAERALDPTAPRLYEEWPDNVYSHQTFDSGGVDEAFAAARRVVRRRLRTGRQTAVPLEGRGCVALFDPAEERLTVWMGHQDVHLARMTLAEVLRLPLSQLRVVAPDTGGAFGAKLPVYPEEMAVCALALMLRRPVKWIQDRAEGLAGDTHARETVVDAELAVGRDGRILALRAAVLSDAGAYAVAGRGPAIEGAMLVRELPGPWRVDRYACDLKVVMTNKAPIAVYRAVSIPVACFVMERLLDAAAAELGLDPLEVRRRNLVDRFPHTTVTGHVYDTGSYREALDLALEKADHGRLQAQVRAWRGQGRLVGVGVCVMNDASARGGTFYGKLGLPASSQEGCSLQIDPTGRALARLGTTSQGQGLGVALAQLIADRLGLPLEDVRVEMGDTATAPYGGGAWASRGAVAGGAAAILAADALRRKLLAIAAHMLEAGPDDVVLDGGRAHLRGAPQRSVTVAEMARLAYFTPGELPAGVEPGLEAVSHWEPELAATFSNAAHVAVVEVLPDTGRIRFLRYVVVEDCGTILNPALVDGQLRGAIAQGLGGAVYEQLVYGPDGQLLTASLMDYLLPGVHEVPDVEIHHLETPSVRTVGGMKGAAEAGVVGVTGAVANAVADALGVEVTELPLTPERVLELVRRRR